MNQNNGSKSSSLAASARSKAALLAAGIRPPTIGTSRILPVLALLDTSGSMDGPPLVDGRAAVSSLAAVLAAPENSGAFHLGLVGFNTKTDELVPLGPAGQFIAPEQIAARGMTDFAAALSFAVARLAPQAASAENSRRPSVVFLTDGRHTAGSDPTPPAMALKAAANVVTIGLGPNADMAFLGELASAPELVIRDASSASLAATFASIGAALSRSRRAGVSLAASGFDPFASRRR